LKSSQKKKGKNEENKSKRKREIDEIKKEKEKKKEILKVTPFPQTKEGVNNRIKQLKEKDPSKYDFALGTAAHTECVRVHIYDKIFQYITIDNSDDDLEISPMQKKQRSSSLSVDN